MLQLQYRFMRGVVQDGHQVAVRRGLGAVIRMSSLQLLLQGTQARLEVVATSLIGTPTSPRTVLSDGWKSTEKNM